MEYIIIIILFMVILLIGYYVFDIKIKKMKEVAFNPKLDEIASKFPENKEICKRILEKLNNKKVKIKEEEKEKKENTSLYIAITDTIFIGNIRNTYTRIQTICHECIHSIQSRRLLIFNFVYSNIYIFYFIISIVLSILGILKDIKMQIIIFLSMSFLYYIIRSYLETDAMIKAKYLAKEYMEEYSKENQICTKNDVEEIINEYDRINKLGIPAYNYMIFLKCIVKVIFLIILVLSKGTFFK